jgi:hypothetical protein
MAQDCELQLAGPVAGYGYTPEQLRPSNTISNTELNFQAQCHQLNKAMHLITLVHFTMLRQQS